LQNTSIYFQDISDEMTTRMYHISHKLVARGRRNADSEFGVLLLKNVILQTDASGTKKDDDIDNAGIVFCLNSNLLILGLLLEPRESPSSQLVFLLIVTAPFVLILGRVHLLDDLRHVRFHLGN